MRIRIDVWLDHDRDADILSYLDGLSTIRRGRIIRDLLRNHINEDNAPIRSIVSRIDRKIDELMRMPRYVTQQDVVADRPTALLDKSALSQDELENILDNIDKIGV